jgi:hypothetical protein
MPLSPRARLFMYPCLIEPVGSATCCVSVQLGQVTAQGFGRNRDRNTTEVLRRVGNKSQGSSNVLCISGGVLV